MANEKAAKKEKTAKASTSNKKTKRYFLRIAIPLILLIAVTLLARQTGLFEGADSMVTINLETIVKVIIAVAFILVFYNTLSKILSFFTKKTGRVGTMATLISSITKYATILISFCWIASIIGVDVSTIFASIGIVALILGFGAESLVADLVTGVFILFENEYNIGDIIEVDGFRGTVKEIGIRTLSLEDTGGNTKIINNSDLKNIINRSNHGSRAVTDIDVSYDTDLEAMDTIMVEILAEIKAKHPDVFTGAMKYVGVENLGASGITLRCTAEVQEANIFSGRRLLNKELKVAFDKRNISIPFPQLDIHNR